MMVPAKTHNFTGTRGLFYTSRMNSEDQPKPGPADGETAGRIRKEDEMKESGVLFATERMSGPDVCLQPAVAGGASPMT